MLYRSKNTKVEKIEFMENLLKTKSATTIADDLYNGLCNDFPRFMAIISNKKCQVDDLFKVLMTSPQSVILSRIIKLAEIAIKDGSPVRNKSGSQNEILNKLKINWIDEIFKMGGSFTKIVPIHGKKFGEFAHSISSNASSGNNTLLCKITQKKDASENEYDIEINISENNIYEVKSMVIPNIPKKPIQWSKPRKGVFLYGPTGIFSFCESLFCLGKMYKTKLNLFDDINPLLERFRGKDPIVRTNSNKELVIDDLAQIRAKDDSVFFFNSLTNLKKSSESSSLVEALIDSKKLSRFSSIIKCDDPFISFSSTTSCQFFLFCAFYYSRYLDQPYEVVKVKLN